MTYSKLVQGVRRIGYLLGISFAVWVMTVLTLEMGIGRQFDDRTELWQFVSDPVHLILCTSLGAVIFGLLFIIKKVSLSRDSALAFIRYIGNDAVLLALRNKAQELDEAFDTETKLQGERKKGLMVSAEDLSVLSKHVIYTARVKGEFWEFHRVAKSAGVSVYTSYRAHIIWEKTHIEQTSPLATVF